MDNTVMRRESRVGSAKRLLISKHESEIKVTSMRRDITGGGGSALREEHGVRNSS